MAIFAQQTNSDENRSFGTTSRIKAGQSFTTTQAGDVGIVKLTLIRVGSPTTLTAEIYDSSGDFPTGPILSSGTYDVSSITTSEPGVEVEIPVSSYTFSDATKYVLVFYLTGGGDDSNYLLGKHMKFSFGDNYTGGEEIYNDGTWKQQGIPGVAYIDFKFSIETSSHAKATDPTPANGATEVDFSTPTLSWSGTGDTYDVRGGAAGNFVLLSSGQAGTSYTLDSAEKLLFRNGVVTWRVDSTKGGDTLTGDDWTFDPRPGKATSPTPSDSGSDIPLTQAFSWTLGTNATTNTMSIGGVTYVDDTGDNSWSPTADAYTWSESVSWEVDSTNEYGTTAGDTWTFDALAIDHLRLSFELISGGSGNGPYDDPPGVLGTDYQWNGLNNVITVRRLVVAANNKIWYETL